MWSRNFYWYTGLVVLASIIHNLLPASLVPHPASKLSVVSTIAQPFPVANADSAVVEAQVAAIMEGKKPKMQDAIVDELMRAESDGYKQLGFDSRDALVTYDPDRSGKGVRIPSFGCLQRKTQTVQLRYAEKNGVQLSQIEAQRLAQSCVEVWELARFVVFELNKGVSEWVNSFQKKGLQAKVEAVNTFFKD